MGDHATSRVNTIYYSKNGVSDGKVTYTYDGMGNIISVNENGKQRYKYAYDKIGRLVSEKDLDGNREICYTYDNSGNKLLVGGISAIKNVWRNRNDWIDLIIP